ncbi:MAG TPA: hypothetical protein VHG89_12200 [Verrucomicrobiae bacterium]|nr:hypothetical protein [Verrucomicrobiae bacterium]
MVSGDETAGIDNNGGKSEFDLLQPRANTRRKRAINPVKTRLICMADLMPENLLALKHNQLLIGR